MNKIIVRSIVYSASLLMILGLASCGTAITPPIYQGMSIERNTATVSAHPLNGEGGSSSATSENDQGEDDPSIDDSELASQVIGEDIEDIVDIVVEGDSGTKYYVSKGEAFQVSINIYNPSQFEILSFTLNGYKYANNMFAYGSTLSKILIDMTAGTESGLFEYTIDAIKYVDGTDIKDVIMDGEKTIKTGVKYDAEPSASVTNQTIHTTSISMRINVTDEYDLIGTNELKVYLSDGETVIGSQDLIVGNNDIEFIDLKMGKLYQYAVMTAYDVVDGNGMLVRTLAKAEFETLKAFLIDNLSVGQENVSFEIAEYGEIGTLTSISLHDDSEGYPAVQVPTDLETRTFSGLFTDHAYILRIEYSYLNGTETLYETDLVRFTTLSKVVPTVSFSNIDSDQDSVFFTLAISDVDRVGSLTKIELFQGATLLQTLTDLSKRAFDGLLSNNAYTVTATYEYDLNDGFGMKPIVINASKATLAKATPTMAFTDAVAEQESITFELGINDIDSVGSLTSVELLKGATVVETMTVYEDTTFYGLLSDTAYILRATYTYDLNDGARNQTLVVTQNIRTLAKAVPVVEIYDVSSTQESISFDIDVLDSDGVGHISTIELYKDEVLISTYDFYQESWPTLFTFNYLLSNNLYTIKVSYSFDLNDGNGVQIITISENYKTAPHLAFNNCQVINTSAVSEGETIYMQVSLDNPSGAIPLSVEVNGQSYNCASSTSASKIYVEIVNNGQFEGGLTILTIERVYMKLDDITYIITPAENNSDEIFINGVITIVEYSLVNQDNKVVNNDFVFNYESVIFKISLNNKTNYLLDSIRLQVINYYGENNISLTSITCVDFIKEDNSYYFDLELQYGWNRISLLGLTYHNEYISKEDLISFTIDKDLFIYKVNTNYTTEIRNLSDLLNSNYNGGYYKLMSDIDASGIAWKSLGALFGVFDGNGYEIRNMTNVSTFTNQDVNISLFTGGYGIIKNLGISDLVFMVTLNSTSTTGYGCNLSALVNNQTNSRLGKSEVMQIGIFNCIVNADISVTNNTNGIDSSVYVGGLMSDGYTCSFALLENNNVQVNFNVKTYYEIYGYGGKVGGLMARTTEIFISRNNHISGYLITAGTASAAPVFLENYSFTYLLSDDFYDVIINSNRVNNYN